MINTRRAVAIAVPLLGLLVATACGPMGQQNAAGGSSSGEQPPAPAAASAPPSPKPSVDGTCPYLETEFVADANGQHVGKVRLSADKPHPACFFYRPDGSLQLTARVYVGDPATAKAVVDQVAPVATSSPADLDGGWRGGSQPTADGAVYAVAKGGSAVVVTTNQKQTIKGRRVAEQVITTLRL